MLSAVIVNLQLLRKRQAEPAPAPAQPQPSPRGVELEVRSQDETSLRIWTEPEDLDHMHVQLFCPSWRSTSAGAVQLQAFEQSVTVPYAAGERCADIAGAVAAALERWFDVTVPAHDAEAPRVRLSIQLKKHPGLAASSTDGMVLLSSDGKGFDVEVGLDEPSATGGVVSVALDGQISRFNTHPGQHGSEVVNAIAQALTSMGCLVRLEPATCVDSYRARVTVLVHLKPEAPAARRTA